MRAYGRCMMWLAGVLVLGVVLFLLDRRQSRREREDLARPGIPVRRAQPRRGVGHLGEAPAAIHHRLGGRRADD